nr:AEC family transporter [Coralloluteibacterium stylophorae]
MFVQQFALSVPLFGLILLGYGLIRWAGWPRTLGEALTRFVFSIALPAMLFRLMAGFAGHPPVDARLLLAFFGGCLLVFALARLVAWRVFGLDGSAQTVFAMGAIFSNNLLLGVPVAQATLGERALTPVALVIVFNSLILWTLATVSIEWARSGRPDWSGLRRTLAGVLRNPLIAAILAGTVFGLTGLELPHLVDDPLARLAQTATPMALVALGMGLAEYGIGAQWRLSGAIAALKLVVLPLVVWGLAWAIALPPLETRVVVLLGSMASGANVYLMSRRFGTLEGATASSLVLSTAGAALTTPVFLTLLRG